MNVMSDNIAHKFLTISKLVNMRRKNNKKNDNLSLAIHQIPFISPGDTIE